MSDYSDTTSGFGSIVFTLLLIVGFVLYAIVKRGQNKNR